MNDMGVIPGSDEYAAALQDAADPIYQKLMAEVARDGEIISLGEGEIADAPEITENVIGRVVVDFVLSGEVDENGEHDLQMNVYPAVAKDHTELLPYDALVGMSRAALTSWIAAYRSDNGLPPEDTEMPADAPATPF